MKQAISYVRYSHPSQKLGSSERRQVENAEVYCKQNEIELLPLSFRDFDQSAYMGKHINDGGKLKALITACQDGSINPGTVLLVEAIDRLSRLEEWDALDLFKSLCHEHGLVIITMEDSMEYSRSSLKKEPWRWQVLLGKIQQAREFSERLSMRKRKSYEQKHKDIIAGKRVRHLCPAWLDFNTVTEQYEINDLGAIVRRCFILSSQPGFGYSKIIKTMDIDCPGKTTWHQFLPITYHCQPRTANSPWSTPMIPWIKS